MFFRMLRNDLRENRGMNVILFLFITVASALVFVSAAQIFSSLTGEQRTKEICGQADGALLLMNVPSGSEEQTEKVLNVLKDDEAVISYVAQEQRTLEIKGVDFENFDESESDTFLSKTLSITKQYTDAHRIFSVDDEPFYLKNGQIAVPQNIRIITGSEIGDTLRITTAMGNIYEFEIAYFYKRTENWNRLYLSEADYDALEAEFPIRRVFCQVWLSNPSYRAMQELSERVLKKSEQYTAPIFYDRFSADNIFSSIIALFMIAVSVFMILLIIMTIRFTMIAALKDEEKGIGMMRAIGVDSFSFRWLFAAKFIAFAVIGGLIGIAAGFPLSKRVILEFSSDVISPEDGVLLMIGAGAVAVIIAVMILFSLSVMRRIKRISIMDAIRCENSGERFRKASRFSLQGRKRMQIPLFLAVSDFFTRLKRYIFLILSYTLGAAIILLVVSLHTSIITPNYLKYDLISGVDFSLKLSKQQMKPYNDKTKYEGIPFWYQINEELKEAGIPAVTEFYNAEYYTLYMGEFELGICSSVYDLPDMSVLIYREGTIPEKANECALSFHTADQWGIGIGSELTLESMDSYIDEDGVKHGDTMTVTVTALVDYMEQGSPLVVMGREYEPAERPEYMTHWISHKILSDDKEAVFAQLQEHFGAEHVITPQQYMSTYLGEFETILTTMTYAVTAAVIIVLALITVLYVNIFLGEDKPEIALLRSLGFSNGSVYLSQLLRMLILTLISIAAAIILTKTAGLALARMLIGIYVGLTGFEFEPMLLFTYLILPLLLCAAVLIPTLIRLTSVRNVDIRDISEE